ncbi:hypothetical protein VZT92_019543 [Zoarces viviparus]|uniref:Uncharacterized protein n=1 Tax=Zoarces viviparus TaxID=48416 RepID=A0AAW1EKF3_ZOAVI
MYPSLKGVGDPLPDVCPRPSPQPVVQPDPRAPSPPPPPPPPAQGPLATQPDTRQHRERQGKALDNNTAYQQHHDCVGNTSQECFRQRTAARHQNRQ